MFKRVERKRKRREEEEELCLDQDTREAMGLNDTESDESDSGSEPESAHSDVDIVGDNDQEEDVASRDEGLIEGPPMSVAEALKDPIYLVSLHPTVHGCVLCKGKLIKNTGMAAAHKNAKVHKRRFEHFRLLSADADPHRNAWELVRANYFASNERTELQEPSKRALKRQAQQAVIREKRKRHKDLKMKGLAKKALKRVSTADERRPASPFELNLQSSPMSQNQPGKTPKKQKLELKTITSTIMETRGMAAKSASRTKTSSNGKKSGLKSKLNSTGKANKSS